MPPAQIPAQKLEVEGKVMLRGWACKVCRGRRTEGLWSGQEGTPWGPDFKERKNCMLFLSCTPPTHTHIGSLPQPTSRREGSVPILPFHPSHIWVCAPVVPNCTLRVVSLRSKLSLGDPAMGLEELNSPQATSPTHLPAHHSPLALKSVRERREHLRTENTFCFSFFPSDHGDL